MPKTLTNTDPWIAQFERLEQALNSEFPTWLRPIRKGAIARFDDLGYPTPRDEAWRFTDLSPIKELPFVIPDASVADPLLLAQIAEACPLANTPCCLVFVDGRYSPAMSRIDRLPPGAIVSSLADVLQTRPQLAAPHLARYASYPTQPFIALNTAFLQDGAMIHLANGTATDAPIHLIYISTAPENRSVSYPRNLIVVGSDCQAKVVETYLGINNNTYLTNSVTEIVLGDRSVIDHYKFQDEHINGLHIGTVQAIQSRSSRFSSHWLSFGGQLVRNETNVRLNAPDCECRLNGLYVAGRKQHVDSRTRIDHAVPHGHSEQVYKGILEGHATAVFNGAIHVHQDAQKTDAQQSSQALLLSDDAQIHAKPELEIFADDVKCTHGSTVGREDTDALFYLQTRGIDRQQAHDLLVYAFANSIVSQIAVPSVRLAIETRLLEARGLPRMEHMDNVP